MGQAPSVLSREPRSPVAEEERRGPLPGGPLNDRVGKRDLLGLGYA